MVCYNVCMVLVLILFQIWFEPADLHRTHSGLQHRNVCNRRCPGYLPCLIRGVRQICNLGIPSNLVSHGGQDDSRVINGQFIYQRERLPDMPISDTNPVIIPSQDSSSHTNRLQSNAVSLHEQHKENINRQREHRLLYNSRIGNAITHTLRNKLGRTRDARLQPGTDRRQNFTSTRWRQSTDLTPVNNIIDKATNSTNQDVVPVTPSLTITSGDDNSCSPCDTTMECSGGNYCYYSSTCAVRICQPL